MTEKDYNYIAKIEKAIQDKYGEETVQHPRANWTDEKEEEYIQQAKKLYQKTHKAVEAKDKVEVDGFLISKKLLNKDTTRRTCPVCKTYSFSKKDDVYMNKFECCYKCYIQWVDNREERWLSGWRPNKQEKD